MTVITTEHEDAAREIARLSRALDEERALLDRLARIAPALASELDPDRLMQALTDKATAVVGAQFGAFFYNVERGGGSYLLYTLSGAPREAFESFGMPRSTKVFAPTFTGECVVRSDDITKDPRYGKNPPHHGMPAGHLPVVSYLAVPVRSMKGNVVGGLFFGHALPGVFTEREERAAVALSAMAGAALDNSRLFERLAERESALDMANRNHQLVFKATREGLWFWDLGANTVDWNDALLEAMGISRETWKGTFEDWFERVHPEDQPRMAGVLDSHLKTREPYVIDLFRLRHADGDYRWYTTAGQAEWGEDGRPVRMAGSVRDVTAKKLAEDALRRAMEEQRKLAEASAILARSIDYDDTLANVASVMVPAIADWCAVDVIEGSATRRIAVAHSDPSKVELAYDLERRWPQNRDAAGGVPGVLRTGRAEMVLDISDAMLTTAARDEAHLSTIRALGLRSYIIVPMKAHDRILGAITLVTEGDRTFRPADLGFAEELARRASDAFENAVLYREVRALNTSLEQRVQERTSELLEANKELESFSYTVSHDLRAPIRHISGFVDLLRSHAQEKLDPKSLHYVDTVKQAATQMGTLIDGLLAFSRLGRAELSKRDVALEELVTSVVREQAHDTKGRDVKFSVGPLPLVWGDPTMLRIVLSNLIGNGVKYTRKRQAASIEVGAEARQHDVLIWVKDNGTGFNTDYMPKLFGVFQRLHSDDEFQGTGIGLATARRIVHRHGGRIWAESALDRGSTFFFTLPRIEEHHD
jgi:PAS domain S-box-containing protein